MKTTTHDKKDRHTITSLYLISLAIIMAVAIAVFPSMIHYGYSQKSDKGISLLGSSSFTAPNEDGLEYYHIVGEIKNNSPTDSINNVKIVATFYDNSRKVVGTDFTYTNVDVIR